ncbi:unknown [Clostridium sp. CAG:557]|nr:unknown [Clostridium sp. CAG:557]
MGITAFTVLGSSIGYSLICLYQKWSDTITFNTNKSKVEKTLLKDQQSILLENATPDENFLLKELQSVSLKKNISRKSKKDNKKIFNVIKMFSAIIGAFLGFTYKLGLIKGRRFENENNLFDLEEKLLYANKAKQARLEELKMLLKQVKDMIAPSNCNFFEKSISSFDCIVYWFEKMQHSNVYFEVFFNRSDYTEQKKLS